MTGGGFGGSAIVLAEESDVQPLTKAVEEAFTTADYRTPRVFEAVPSAGARRLD
jgi:galactokinase